MQCTSSGSLVLEKELLSAKYILLHTKNDEDSGRICKISKKGAKIYSKDDMIKANYPSPKHDSYIVFELEDVESDEFQNVKWNFKDLANYKTWNLSAYPFTVSLTDLMKTKTGKVK